MGRPVQTWEVEVEGHRQDQRKVQEEVSWNCLEVADDEECLEDSALVQEDLVDLSRELHDHSLHREEVRHQGLQDR